MPAALDGAVGSCKGLDVGFSLEIYICMNMQRLT
jgi:hypothetical protein